MEHNHVPHPANGQRANLTSIKQHKSYLAQPLQIKPKKQKNQPETVEETKARQAAPLHDDEEQQVKAAKGMGGSRCDRREGGWQSSVPGATTSQHSPLSKATAWIHTAILICFALKYQVNYTSVATKNKDTQIPTEGSRVVYGFYVNLTAHFSKSSSKFLLKLYFTLANRDPNNITKKTK